jgi:hypothetical protein
VLLSDGGSRLDGFFVGRLVPEGAVVLQKIGIKKPIEEVVAVRTIKNAPICKARLGKESPVSNASLGKESAGKIPPVETCGRA